MVDARKQAMERFSAQIAEGVSHFPRPTHAPVPEVSDAIVDERETHFETQVLGCTRCPLASAERVRVVARDPRNLQTVPRIFVLADFADVADEQNADFFAEGAPSHLLTRLFEKLGISKDIYPSFAIKCAPRKGIAVNSLRACSGHLKWELEKVRPDSVLLFGSRAKEAYEIVTGQSLESIEEMGRVETRSALVFVMPSVLELAAYPEWRSAVWRLLQPLRA